MRLMQLIYASRPSGFEAAMLEEILVTARRCNERDGLTGALICRRDLFIQMLEGPRDKVTATFGRILQDRRHVDVSLVWCGDTSMRIFADWTMRDDPVMCWMWTRAELRLRDVTALAAVELRQVFVRLAKQPQLGWSAAAD
ncbi:BLUF domain-containing protein [Falsiroseomonas sp.]|uniref:BLUF domain-containing protein n=1 Tax=Falsiroseomonas sp. TaxID=2870721 RepID=UPI003568F323